MRFQHSKSAAALLAITLVVAGWFSPWWAGGKVLAPLDLLNGAMSPWHQNQGAQSAKNHFVSDAVDQYLVYRMIAAEQFRKEGWIGWSSLTYGGTAQYANTMALYSDWTMQLHRWFDFWTAWHLGLMAQTWIAAAGMWWWLKGRNTGGIWPVCGALLFAFNSQFVTWIYHRWTLGSFCWVPWILASIDRHENGSRFHRFAVPAFIGLAFLGGTLQHAALVMLVVVARWMEQAWSNRLLPHGEGGSTDFARFTRRISDAIRAALSPRLLGTYAVWGIAGIAISSFMWFPCVAAFLESERVGIHIGLHGHAPGMYPGGPMQPLLNLASYPLQWFPSVLGRCDSLDVLKLFKSELFYVAYFGALPVLVAFMAVFLRRTSPLARLLIVFGLFLPLTPLVRLLYQRLLILFILGGILAFTQFMHRADERSRILLAKVLARSVASMAAAWLLMNFVLLAKPGWIAVLKAKAIAVSGGGSFGYFQAWTEQRVDRFIDGLFIWSPVQLIPFACLAVGLIGLRLTASPLVSRLRSGQAMLAAACVAEVLWFSAGWVVWADPIRQPLFAETPETRALRENVGHEGRTTTLIHPSAHMALTPFIPNTLAAYGIASIHGYDSIVPDGMLRPFQSADDAELLGRLAVTHLITWSGNRAVPEPWSKVWESSSMALYQNPLALPRCIGFEDQAALDRFHRGMTTPYTRLVEQGGLENSRRIEVPSNITRIRIAENQASGWQFRLPGEATWNEVPRGPDACMEVPMPPSSGSRILELRYRPPLRLAGFRVSAASLLLLAAIASSSFAMRAKSA
jgi:hypothetical protein